MSDFLVIENEKYYLDFRWVLKTFSGTSPTFCVSGCDIVWKIVLVNTFDGYSEVKLQTDSFTRGPIKTVKPLFSFEIRSHAGKVLCRKAISMSFTKAKESSGFKQQTLSMMNTYNGFIISGQVILLHDSMEKSEYVVDKNLSSLQHDFGSFLQDRQQADVSLILGNETIPAHKFVLCSRSVIFNRMFANDMKEAQTNSVTIVDVEKPVFDTFLVFLYSGILENKTFDTVFSLYAVADKYCVESLQDTCRDILINTMSTLNIVSVLKASQQHNDDHLKDASSRFICEHFKEVYPTPEWNDLLESNVKLAAYVLNKLSAKIAKK